ncbi:MAG: hypothetical protein AAF772_08895 [Acidobacteriota bacterium]
MLSLPSLFSSLPRAARIVLLVALVAMIAAVPSSAKRGADDAQIAGRVIDVQSEKPVAGVDVAIYAENAAADAAPLARARTDADGAFEVRLGQLGPTDARSANLRFALQHPDYAPFDASAPVRLKERFDFTFRLLDSDQARVQADANRAADDRNRAISYYNEAVAAYEASDAAGARRALEAAAAADVSLPEPHRLLADLALSAGEIDAARAAIDRYRALAPDEPLGLGLAYRIVLADGADLATLAPIADALRAAPGGADHARVLAAQVYNDGARVSQEENGTELAAARFVAAAALDPKLGAAHAGLATLRYNVEDYEGALAALRPASALAADNLQGRRVHYLVLDALGRADEAEAAFAAYHAVDAARAIDLRMRQANEAFRFDEIDAVERYARGVLAHDADVADAHRLLGQLSLQRDPAASREHLTRFLALAPDHPEADTVRIMLESI